MKARMTTIIGALTLVLALGSIPAFAQGGGLGVGVGLGSQTKVGVGGGANSGTNAGVGVHVGGTNVGAHTETDLNVTRPNANAQDSSQSRVADRIEGNAQLAARVQSMLPTETSMRSAAEGFKNEGQFLSALHASQNLNIPFDHLKTKVTGSNSMSLGSAIKASKPELSESQARQEAMKAEAAAKATVSAKGATSAAATKPSRRSSDTR